MGRWVIERAVKNYVKFTNDNSKLCVRTKTADEFLETLARFVTELQGEETRCWRSAQRWPFNSAMEDHVTCIIGMHRSGTSMVAQLLHQSGLYLGSKDQLLGASSGNQDGHFEHVGFLKINAALLRHFGGSWEFPPGLEPGWETDASLAELRNSARSLIETFSGRSPWGWKEPRTTILLPFWRSVIPKLRLVICVRSPLEVAKSLAKRNGISLERGVLLWYRYLRAALQDSAGRPRMIAFYDDFFSDATAEAYRLIDFCGLTRPSDLSILDDGIRGELRHQRSEISELLGAPSIPAECKLMYLGLRALSGREHVPATPHKDSAENAGELLRVLDELRDQERLAQLQTELTEKNYELSKLRNEMLNDLKANHRWAYRIYRKFIRPFRSF